MILDPEVYERKLREARQELLRRLAERQQRLAGFQEDTEKHYADHLADLAQLDQDRELEALLSSQELEQLREIEAALERIRTHTYGMCERCGQPIEPERLNLLPQTRYCASCAQSLES